MKHLRLRITELDGLRGIAALAVVLYHYTTRFGQKFDTNLTRTVWEFEYGRYGVDLFFIISGFVIFMTIEKLKHPAEFIYKRFIRLYPTFWCCMLLTFFLMKYFGPALLKRSTEELLINISMVPSLFGTRAIDGVYWSLLIELCFYGFMLLLLLLQLIPKMKYVGLAFLLFYFAVCFWHKYHPELYYGSLFLMGISFYKIWKGDKSWIWHLQILMCLVLSLFSPQRIDFIVTALFCALFYLFVYRQAGFLRFRPLVFIGEISYALYLIHQHIGHTIQLWLIREGITNYYLLLLWPIFMMILVAYLITTWFEKPVIAYLSRIGKKTALWN